MAIPEIAILLLLANCIFPHAKVGLERYKASFQGFWVILVCSAKIVSLCKVGCSNSQRNGKSTLTTRIVSRQTTTRRSHQTRMQGRLPLAQSQKMNGASRTLKPALASRSIPRILTQGQSPQFHPRNAKLRKISAQQPRISQNPEERLSVSARNIAASSSNVRITSVTSR